MQQLVTYNLTSVHLKDILFVILNPRIDIPTNCCQIILIYIVEPKSRIGIYIGRYMKNECFHHLVNFVFVWYIFSGLGVMNQEKSGNPGVHAFCS
jgi:hypothetical protein